MTAFGRIRFRPAVFAATAGLVVAGSAHAQLVGRAECDEPLDASGEVLEVVGDVATLTGSVRLVQCDAVLSAEKLVGQQDEAGAYKSLKVVGDVRYGRGDEAISSREALYDRASRTITFTGDVVVTQGEQVMTGGALVYWVDTGRIRFTAPAGQRIRGIIRTDALETPA